MTYLEFLLIFLLPPLAWLLAHPRGPAGQRWLPLLMSAAALLYTAPWDNYLVFKGVWVYGRGRVLGTILYVPIEEYLFFLLQPLATGWWALWAEPVERALPQRGALVRWGGLAACASLSLLGAALLLEGRHALYLGLILAWAGPVLAAQWAFGGDLLYQQVAPLLRGVALPTLYLWAADDLAIHLGIWRISAQFSSGFQLLGLPLEEAVFFLVTNVLVVQGVLLLRHPLARARALALGRSLRPWSLLLALGLALNIPVPLWPRGFLDLATASTVCLALSALLWAGERLGGRAILLALRVCAIGWAVEWVGSHSGLPFGSYRYPEQPLTLLGVPLLVPLGWWAMSVAALSLARGRAWLAGLLMVGWDLGLEPLMTHYRVWTWSGGSSYYGVPLLNFVSWWWVGSLLCLLITWLAPRLKEREFAWTYRLETLFLPAGLLLLGFYLAAALTALAMGLLTWISSLGASSA